MDLLRVSRAIGGLVSIMTLHALIILDVLYEDIILEGNIIAILLVMIGALLGVDALLQESINIDIQSKGDN